MSSLNRRYALAFSLTAAGALPALLIPGTATAQRYRADAGEQLAPGVRRVELSKRASEIPAYASVAMVDIVFQPKSKYANPSMASDMVCHCLEGELAVDQGTGKEFLVKAGDVWSCKKGMPETTENRGTTVAIMRVIPLLAPA
jgi:quercetin dioxygenase-like cupin family protein